MHGTYLKTMTLCNVSFAMVMMTLIMICQICYHIVIILLSCCYHIVINEDSPQNMDSCFLDKGFAVLRGCNKMISLCL